MGIPLGNSEKISNIILEGISYRYEVEFSNKFSNIPRETALQEISGENPEKTISEEKF